MNGRWLNVISLWVLLHNVTYGQIGESGLPASYRNHSIGLESYPAGIAIEGVLPDWDEFLVSFQESNAQNTLAPYPVGIFTPVRVRFPESGYFHYEGDGSVLWKAKFEVRGALAIGLYYENFYLPKGVRLFAYNDNGSQVLGAYTHSNNAEDGKFAQEGVQGSMVQIELNIDPGVDLRQIQLYINRALIYFRGVEYLQVFSNDREDIILKRGSPDPYKLEGRSSHCMINAACPEGLGFEVPRKSTVQMLLIEGNYGAFCSGTLINNTGNTGPDQCRPFVLTASHCGGGNQNAHFSQWLFRFNFEKEQCTGGAPATVNTMTGANFRARSYDEVTQFGVPDFLLLELRTKIPDSWDVFLSGWDRSATKYTRGRYIGFHHPDADVKKLSFTDAVSEYNKAWIQEFKPDATHGGVSVGSSGSGLFNPDKRLIGIASMAGNQLEPCMKGNSINPNLGFYLLACYYALGSAWSPHEDADRSLMSWLDPVESGVITLDGIAANCEGITGITRLAQNGLEQYVSIYPNPNADGRVKLQFNMPYKADFDIEVYDITGKRCLQYEVKDVINGIYSMDMHELSAGVYLIKMTDGQQLISKKLILNK